MMRNEELNSYSNEDRATYLWAGIHLLLALSLPLILVMLAGCKQAKAKREDLGPEVASSTINGALSKAIESASLANLAKGQFVRYSHTRRIENEENAIDLGERHVEVIDRADTPTEAHFTNRIIEKERIDSGSYRYLYTEDALWIGKLGTSSIPDALRAPSPNALSAESLRAEAATLGKSGKITFHHLHEEDATADPPAAMKLRADCGGIPNCVLHVHYLQFDMVFWQDDTNYQKISFDFAFSLDTPYIPYGEYFEQYNGTLVTDCRSTFVPIQERTVYVRDCYNLEDFKK